MSCCDSCQSCCIEFNFVLSLAVLAHINTVTGSQVHCNTNMGTRRIPVSRTVGKDVCLPSPLREVEVNWQEILEGNAAGICYGQRRVLYRPLDRLPHLHKATVLWCQFSRPCSPIVIFMLCLCHSHPKPLPLMHMTEVQLEFEYKRRSESCKKSCNAVCSKREVLCFHENINLKTIAN